jgi:hypothetical protein
MHIDSTSHEHGSSAKVYTYEADYEVQPDTIRWQAEIRHADDDARRIDGAIDVTSPALPTLAEQVVRDAIVKRIDSLDDQLQMQAQQS